MRLYVVLMGSKQISELLAPKTPLHPMVCVFIAFSTNFFKKSSKISKNWRRGRFIFKFYSDVPHLELKRLQSFAKIVKNFKIAFYVMLRDFKTHLYLVLNWS